MGGTRFFLLRLKFSTLGERVLKPSEGFSCLNRELSKLHSIGSASLEFAYVCVMAEALAVAAVLNRGCDSCLAAAEAARLREELVGFKAVAAAAAARASAAVVTGEHFEVQSGAGNGTARGCSR